MLDRITKIAIISLVSLFNFYYIFYEELSIISNLSIVVISIMGGLYLFSKQESLKKASIGFAALLNYILVQEILPSNGIMIDTLLFEVMRITLIVLAIYEIFNIKSLKTVFGILLGIIYLDAAIWKMNSQFWWNGDIFYLEYYINNLTTNQYLIELLKPIYMPSAIFIMLYQATFIFAILFIKNYKIKNIYLGLGIFQHLGIIFLYNLPFFGLFMIAMYIPLFNKEKIEINYTKYFIPLFIIVFINHYTSYSYNKDRVIFNNNNSLIAEINNPKKFKSIYNLNNFLTAYIYKTPNVFIPLKHFSNPQIESILKANKYIFSKKYLRIYEDDKLLISNVPGDKVNSFNWNPYYSRYLNILFLKHSNFQNISSEIKNKKVEEFVYFISNTNNEFKFEKKIFNEEVNDKFKIFIENSVYNKHLIYGLKL